MAGLTPRWPGCPHEGHELHCTGQDKKDAPCLQALPSERLLAGTDLVISQGSGGEKKPTNNNSNLQSAVDVQGNKESF